MTGRAAGRAAAASLLALCSVTACHRDERPPRAAGPPGTPEPESAFVRVVDAIPESRPLDVFAGDAPAFKGVQFRAVTAYAAMSPGTTVFRLRPSGQDRADPLAEDHAGLSRGARYTLVALPGSGDRPATIEVLKDEAVAGRAGTARVRVVNACPDAGEVAVFVGGRTDALVSGVAANTASGYRDVDPIAGTLELRQESRQQVLARLPDTRIESGGFYTVFLLGRRAGGLEAMLVEDQRGPA